MTEKGQNKKTERKTKGDMPKANREMTKNEIKKETQNEQMNKGQK